MACHGGLPLSLRTLQPLILVLTPSFIHTRVGQGDPFTNIPTVYVAVVGHGVLEIRLVHQAHLFGPTPRRGMGWCRCARIGGGQFGKLMYNPARWVAWMTDSNM